MKTRRAAERAGSITCTTRMPSPTVSAPAPPALRITMFVAPPGADRRAVYDQRIGARCGAALVEHRVELQRAAIGDEGAGAGNAPAWRAPVITSTSPATGLLCRSMMPELVNVVHADQVALQRPAERHCVVGVARAGDTAPCCPAWWRLSLRGALSVPLLVKLLFGPVAEVRYGHPERIARRPQWCRRSASGRTGHC